MLIKDGGKTVLIEIMRRGDSIELSPKYVEVKDKKIISILLCGQNNANTHHASLNSKLNFMQFPHDLYHQHE